MPWPCLHAFAMAASLLRLSWPRSGHVIGLATCLQGLPWPWLLAHWRVTFPNEGFFPKDFFFPQKISFRQANMPCSWQNAHEGCLSLFFLPMGATMDLGICMWACHSLGNVPTRASLALAACLL